MINKTSIQNVFSFVLNWSIGRKVLVMGVAAVIAMATLSSVTILSSQRVQETFTRSDEARANAQTASEMNVAGLNLIGAALFTLVDPTLGFFPDQLEIIQKSIVTLRNGATELQKFAETDEERTLATRITFIIGGLEKGILGDMKEAIDGYDGDTDGDEVEFRENLAEYSDLIQEDGAELSTSLINVQKILSTRFEAARSEALEVIGNSMWVAVIAFVLGLAIILPLLAFIAESIIGPVRNLITAMTKLAAGESDTEVPGLDRTNEMGDMAQALQVFKQNVLALEDMQKAELEAAEDQRRQEEESRREEAARAEEEHARALKLAKEEERRGREQAEAEREREIAAQAEAEAGAKQARAKAINELTGLFQSSVGDSLEAVAAAAVQLDETASSMAALTQQTKEQSLAIATASEEASSNVQAVAGAAEQLAISIGEIGLQVERSETMTASAVTETERTNTAIAELSGTAEKIGNVVGLINEIASQTNLLALNATIESARAGEAGKGFAVVASEVKELAGQTAKATDQIGEQVDEIQRASSSAVEAIKGIGSQIQDVNHIAGTIASSVDQQRNATQEIAANVERAAKVTEGVTTSIRDVQAASDQVHGNSVEVLNAARELAAHAEKLQSGVDQFLSQIREAV